LSCTSLPSLSGRAESCNGWIIVQSISGHLDRYPACQAQAIHATVGQWLRGMLGIATVGTWLRGPLGIATVGTWLIALLGIATIGTWLRGLLGICKNWHMVKRIARHLYEYHHPSLLGRVSHAIIDSWFRGPLGILYEYHHPGLLE
jgi:hypothetical protein